MALKEVKPRLVISENNGKWTLRSESTPKTVSVDFIRDVLFDETTPDGREVIVCLLLFRFLIICIILFSF